MTSQPHGEQYDSAIGPYVESDPVGLFGGTNTYLYADSNPIDSSDPTGGFGIRTAAAGAVFDLVMQVDGKREQLEVRRHQLSSHCRSVGRCCPRD